MGLFRERPAPSDRQGDDILQKGGKAPAGAPVPPPQVQAEPPPPPPSPSRGHEPTRAERIAAAQVEATLALAAAIASQYQSNSRYLDEYADRAQRAGHRIADAMTKGA